MASTYYLFTDGSRWERLTTAEHARDKAGILITVNNDEVSYMLGEKRHSLPRRSVGSTDEEVMSAIDAQLSGLLREQHSSHEHESTNSSSYEVPCDKEEDRHNNLCSKDDAYQVAEECCKKLIRRECDDLENDLDIERLRISQLEKENKQLRSDIEYIKSKLHEVEYCNEKLKCRCNNLLAGLQGVLDLTVKVNSEGQLLQN